MKEGVVILLFALVGSSVAIFFTSSKQNDYPRIGRRSFYTTSKENTYPRIGRRSLENTYSKQRHVLAEKRALYTASSENSYPRIGRGVFTDSGNGRYFPRVGRRKESSEESTEDKVDSHYITEHTGNTKMSPLTHRMPEHWDLNEDGIISRKEFIEGFLHARKRRK